MARSLRVVLLAFCVAAFAAILPLAATPAAAAEMDKNAKADAKTAMRLYKEGNYEDAAKIFVRLSIAYPDMLVFVRNLGACYYYMRRYEPALSNLRDYEHRKKDIAPDDRAEVAGWIGEMERLRDQAAAASAPVAAPAPAVAAVPVPVPVAAPTAAVPVAPEPAPSAPVPPAASAPQAPETSSPPQPIENAYPQQGQYSAQPAQPQPAYPQGQYSAQPAQPQPAYPQGQYGAQPPPAYPQGQYGAQPGYPTTQYPPAGGAYPPGSQPAAYPSGTYAAGGVATPANPPPSSGGGRKAVAWILGVVGVGGIAAGGLFTALMLDRFSKVQKKYDPSLEKQGKDYAKLQWVCYGSGAALLTTAIIVGASGGSSSSAVALAPTVGPGIAGATLSGSF